MNSFYEFTTQIELFLGIIHFSPVVKFVTYLFAALTIGLGLFFCVTLLTLVNHKITSHFYKIYHKHYTLWLIQYLINPDLPVPYPSLLFRNSFRGSILDLLLVTKGIEKNTLFQIYRKSGLWEFDLGKLRNPFWHVRLGALVRMDLWQFSVGTERIQHLLEDENIQIRQIAIKNLSRTKEPHEAVIVMDSLIRGYFFYSVQYEAIFRLIRIHRDYVLQCLSNPKYQKLHPLIIKVIGDSRIIEGVPALLQKASAENAAPERELALISLGKIGDPRGLEILKSGLKSLYPKERLAALKSIHLIDQEELENNLSFLRNDTDASVRSWYDHYMRGGQ